MQGSRKLGLALWLVVAAGCGSVAPSTPLDSSGSTGRIAVDPGTAAASLPTHQNEGPYQGPPAVFTPRSHAPLERYTSRPAPALKTLPKLKLRLGECFGIAEPAKKQAAPIATGSAGQGTASRASKGGGGGLGYGGMGAAAGAPQPAKPQAATAAKSSAPAKDSKRKGPGGATKAAEAADSLADMAPAPSSALSEAAAPAPAAPTAKADAAPKSAPQEPAAEKKAAARIAGGDDERAQASGEAASAPAESPAVPEYNDWGAAIYLSNDDTMSLSSAQRVLYAIDNFLPLPSEHIRPHELLNYFSFDAATVQPGFDFSVQGDLAPDPRQAGIYTLALSVAGRPVDLQARRNAAITFVVDRSGSMSDEGRMTYLKRGLKRMVQELKAGDLINIVAFDDEVCVPVENFVVGRDKTKDLERAIDALQPRNSTDLHRGLTAGYELSDKDYQPSYTNRVVLITDALTNTGVTDEGLIAMAGKWYDVRKIRLSGVGVGREFNDALLDRLTERGKGAYVFLGSEGEVDAVFGSHFISLIETTALDVHFRLHLPPSLRMNVFYGEESSTVKANVQEIHYFANTAQLFLSDLMARGGTLRPQDSVMLSIEYKDPETGQELQEEYAFNLGQISAAARNVQKGRLIMTFVDMLAAMASRPMPASYQYGVGAWIDPEGWQRCDEGRTELNRLAAGQDSDREVRRVLELWEKHCSRFERPRHPVRRQVAAPEDRWPSAGDQRR